jgi:serine O-acetyltransferase
MTAWQHARRKHANLRLIRDRHPPFRRAVAADVATALRCRGEGQGSGRPLDTVLEALRLMWTSDAFAALVAYRARAALQRRGVPVLPRLLHHVSMTLAQVCIGDPVLIHPGVYVPHGQIVVDGFTEVRSQSRLLPWTTLGLKEGNLIGPTIGEGVVIGTGARVLGPVHVGDGARVGANAVVVRDVPSGAVAVGVPAVVRSSSPAG